MSPPIDPKNLTAQLQYRAAGNPPSTVPDAAVGNSYPGLEMDFRNVWTRLFVGIRLHEAGNWVVDVEDDAFKELLDGFTLASVAGNPVRMRGKGPTSPGSETTTLQNHGAEYSALEWSNALADVVNAFAGQSVECVFMSADEQRTLTVQLTVRQFFDETVVAGAPVQRPAIARELAPAGALTQSLCAPWQYDYRYCACFYWAATRPDYVNVEARSDATSSGNNWFERNRTPESASIYIVDDASDPRLLTTAELIAGWERSLRFVIQGRDEPPVPKKPEPQE